MTARMRPRYHRVDNEQVRGIDGVLANMDKFEGIAKELAAEAMLLEARGVLEESWPLVPYKTGVLMDSGEVINSVGRAPETGRFDGSVTFVVAYGRPGSGAEAYALVQHERHDFHHPIQGQAKYLQEPLFARAKGMKQRVNAYVKARLP